MLSVFICEDDMGQQELIGTIVKDFIMLEEEEMRLQLVTDDPQAVLHYLDKHPNTVGVYFLDIDLNHEMNGFSLAAAIRERDDLGRIIFVTTHEEMAPITFQYKVEALDFIVKDQPEAIRQRIYDCLKIALERQKVSASNKEQFVLKVGHQTRTVNHEDILFFETSTTPHKVTLHTVSGQIEFYGKMKELEDQAGSWLRVHKSFLVNTDNILSVDMAHKQLEMVNGERCTFSRKVLRELKLVQSDINRL